VKPGRQLASRACWHRRVTREQRRAWSATGGRPAIARVDATCLGCGETFSKKTEGHRSNQRYCSAGCSSIHRSRAPEFAEFRRRRMTNAIAGRRRSAHRQALARVKGLTPVDAYARGYDAGFNTAARWWRHQLERERARKAVA
jgi:hypothetical protein